MRTKIGKIGQLKSFWQYLTRKEKRNVKILALVSLGCLVLVAINSYFFYSSPKPARGGKYSEGLRGQPGRINPIFSRASEIDYNLGRLICSGLMKYNKDLELVPDLAENFQISEDQKEYTFCLKENILWHDKNELTIEDIIFTFDLIKNPVFEGPLTDRFQNIGIQKVDERCLKFNLKRPSSLFLDDLTLGILPAHIWKNIPIEKFLSSEFNLKPVGTGPFKFQSLTRDKNGTILSYTLERNEKFYDKEPNIDEITFKFYPDFESLTSALKRKEIDGFGTSQREITKNLTEIKNLNSYSLSLPYWTTLFFNLRKEAPANKNLSEISLRQALAHLIPRAQIFKEVLAGEGEIIHGPILPLSFFYNPEIKKYEFSPEEAARILDRSGWRKNQDGFLEKDGKNLEISITTVESLDLQKTARLISQTWQNVGIKVMLVTCPPENIQEIIKKRDFQCFLYGVLENLNSDPYPLWHSSQIPHPGTNLTGFSNRRADELLEKASLSEEKETKKEYLAEFQKIIAEEVPAIFLYNASYSYLVDKKIKGINLSSIQHPSDRFIGIEDWYIKTKRVRK